MVQVSIHAAWNKVTVIKQNDSFLIYNGEYGGCHVIDGHQPGTSTQPVKDATTHCNSDHDKQFKMDECTDVS